MTEPAPVQPPPKLPEVESPSRDEVLGSVPTTEDVVERAQAADDIVDQQPTVDDILGPGRA
jgi:hypothetical protein